MSQSSGTSSTVRSNCRTMSAEVIRHINEEVERICSEDHDHNNQSSSTSQTGQINVNPPQNHVSLVCFRERVVEMGARFQVFAVRFDDLAGDVRRIKSHLLLWNAHQMSDSINHSVESYNRMSMRFFERLELVNYIVGMKFVRNELEMIVVCLNHWIN